MLELSTPEQRLQALRRHRWLLTEQAEYPYLPSSIWMRRGGYSLLEVGAYEHSGADESTRNLVMLSQTNMLLLFKDKVVEGGQIVRNDEELLRFLTAHNFPLPE